jgi:uncharacterized protein YgbK (DUF1537 family)
LHLGRQTEKKTALVDVLDLDETGANCDARLANLLAEKPDVVLFDGVYEEHLVKIGQLISVRAQPGRPMFVVGSSGALSALTMDGIRRGNWQPRRSWPSVGDDQPLLVASGSCSPVSAVQIAWAVEHGFADVPLNIGDLPNGSRLELECDRLADVAGGLLAQGKDVIVHTAGGEQRVKTIISASVVGAALGRIVRQSLVDAPNARICIAGGDSSSYAAREMELSALEMLAPLAPGAPLCAAHAPNSPLDGREIVFKGGQVGGRDFFQQVANGAASSFSQSK